MKHSEQQVNGHVKTSQTQQKRFISRVTSIPLVQESVSTVHSYANKTSLGRFALDKANSTLTSVSNYTASHQPKYVQTYYENYVQPHLERADALGCRSLDLLQEKFPVVNHKSKEIAKSSYQALDNVRGRITQPAQLAAQGANKRLANVVDNVEAVLERYLPAPEGQKVKTCENENQAIRAYRLLNDASYRLSQRVTEQIPRSRNDLSNNASAAIQAATDNVLALQAALRQTATVYAEAAKQKLPPSVTARVEQLHATTTARLQVLSQQVSTQLTTIVEYVKTNKATPDWLKARVASLIDIASKQYELVRAQYKRTDITSYEKARNVASGLQEQVLPVLQTVQSQLKYYTEKTDVKRPFEYLGLLKTPSVPVQAQ